MLDTYNTMRNTICTYVFLAFFVAMGCWLQAVWASDAPPAGVTAEVPAIAFFPVLPFDAGDDMQPELVPVSGTMSLAGKHKGVRKAIIIIHDGSRDAAKALADMAAIVGPDNRDTIILAPLFLLETDMARFADHLPESGQNFARWPLGGWSIGGDSLPLSKRPGVSSFTVIDLLMLSLADRERFPDIEQIAVAGNADGGEFVDRYAAVSRAAPFIMQQQLSVRYVVGNPSSYLYFTPARFRGGKQGFGPPDPQICKGYNLWPYGLDSLNDYGKRVGPAAIKQNVDLEHIAYIMGAGADRQDGLVDMSCAALLNGKDRLARQSIYQTYMGILFGDAMRASHYFATVADAGYDAQKIYSSRCAMALLLGDGQCEQAQ